MRGGKMNVMNSIVWKSRSPNQGDQAGTIKSSSKALAEPAAVLSTKQLQALKNVALTFFELENKKVHTTIEEDRKHWAKNIGLLEATVRGLKSVLEEFAIENPHLKRNGVEGAGVKISVNVFDYPHGMEQIKAVRMNVCIRDGKGKNLYHEELVFRFSSSYIVYLDTKTGYDHMEAGATCSGNTGLFAGQAIDSSTFLLWFNLVAERIMKENKG
jgi:hypothetical protein